MYIEITIPASVPSRDWQRLAMKYAREDAEELGAEFQDCEILVKLPEGRCYYKAHGSHGFGSYR